MTQIKCRPPTVSYLASSVKPHCAQAWRGDQPSLSRASMKALFSSNIFAISTLPSILTCRDLCIKKQPNLELKIICKMSGCKCVLRKPPPPFYTGPPYPWQIITVLLTCTMYNVMLQSSLPTPPLPSNTPTLPLPIPPGFRQSQERRYWEERQYWEGRLYLQCTA